MVPTVVFPAPTTPITIRTKSVHPHSRIPMALASVLEKKHSEQRMTRTLREIVGSFDPGAPLNSALTIPGPWYTDEGVAELERKTVFSRTWQIVGRAEQVAAPGQYI